jgi:hypothetical protein
VNNTIKGIEGKVKNYTMLRGQVKVTGTVSFSVFFLLFFLSFLQGIGVAGEFCPTIIKKRAQFDTVVLS